VGYRGWPIRVGDSCQPLSPGDAAAQAQLTRNQDLDSPNRVGADKASEAAPENPGRSLVRLFRVGYRVQSNKNVTEGKLLDKSEGMRYNEWE